MIDYDFYDQIPALASTDWPAVMLIVLTVLTLSFCCILPVVSPVLRRFISLTTSNSSICPRSSTSADWNMSCSHSSRCCWRISSDSDAVGLQRVTITPVRPRTSCSYPMHAIASIRLVPFHYLLLHLCGTQITYRNIYQPNMIYY